MLLHCLSNDGQETAVIFMEARQAIPTFLSFIKDTTTKRAVGKMGQKCLAFPLFVVFVEVFFSNEINKW